MPIDLSSKPDTRIKLQKLAVQNDKTVDEVAAMSDEDLLIYGAEVMLAALYENQATGEMALSVVGSGGGNPREVAVYAPKQASPGDKPMTEERKQQLMGHLYRPPAEATK